MDVSPADSATIESIAAHVNGGKCILFLGAAVHAPPPADASYVSPEAERPPLGGSFSQHLAELSRLAARYPNLPDVNLQRVALDFEIQFNRMRLVDEIE